MSVRTIHRFRTVTPAETVRADTLTYGGDLLHFVIPLGQAALYDEGEDAVVETPEGVEFVASIVEVDPSEARVTVEVPYPER